MQKPVADVAGSDDVVAYHDFIAVGVVEISCRSLPARFIEFDADFFVDAGFRLQVGIAHVVAADVVCCAERTALASCVEDEIGVGLI